jgi:lambda repressor-like predicted transcriptional regulator
MNRHAITITREIKAALALAGIYQTDIARKVGVHPVHVNDVIYGRRPTPRIRAAIAEAINKPVSEIWPDAKPEEQAA